MVDINFNFPANEQLLPNDPTLPSDIFGAKSESGGRLKAVPLKIDQANISTGPRQCSWGHFQAWWKPMGLATKSRNYRQVRLIGLELTDTSYFRLFSTAAFPSCGLSNHHNHLQINYLAAALTTLFRSHCSYKDSLWFARCRTHMRGQYSTTNSLLHGLTFCIVRVKHGLYTGHKWCGLADFQSWT